MPRKTSSAPSVARCYERKRARGLVRVPVWIPDTPEARAVIREAGRLLRGEAQTEEGKKGTP